ncbi:MAG TPA: hypothetical protein VM452_03800 [Caulifigura sp.]|nr:hypothetical protein [Caulifigura sp.]
MKQSFFPRETSSSRGQALAILGVLLFCLPLIWSGLRTASFDGRTHAQRDGNVLSTAEDELIVTWKGSRLEDARIKDLKTALIGEVAADGLLRGGSPYVAEVVTANELLSSLVAAEMPADAAARSLSGLWLGQGGLKIRATSNGRRNLEWTAKRIESELNAVPGRQVTVSQFMPLPGSSGETSAIEIPDYDLEVHCATASDPLAVPASLKDEISKVRGYPTASEPEGQRLVEDAFIAAGTPVAMRVRLTEAGRAEPAAAAMAVRRAATSAGIAGEDLLLTGTLLTISEKADALRASVSPGTGMASSLRSPVILAIAIAAVLGVVVGGYSVDLVCSIFLGAVGAAGLAAGMNALGVAWTENLLLVPPFVLLLTIATTLLEPAARGGISARVRKPMSASTMLCALCLVTLLVGSNMQRFSDRQFALAGAAGCGLAWLLSTVCVPALASLLGSGSIRRATHGLDFAEWIVAHQQITTTAAAVVGIASAAVLMQPSVQDWLADTAMAAPSSAQYQIEQQLGGTSELQAEIRFDAERTQRLRFLERASIVRAAVEKVKASPGVTGAMSLAEAAPEVARPDDQAKTRERTAYIARSNRVSEQLREQNQAMGGRWIRGGEAGDVGESATGETWLIQASVASISSASPKTVLTEIHRGIQEVLRFHAGVSHELSGDVVIAADHSSTPSRRPGVLGALVVLTLIVTSLGTRSPVRGLVLTMLVAVPGLAVLLVPGFHPEQFGVASFLAIAASLSIGVLSCVRLVNDLAEWSAATSTRHEAIAFALTGSTSRSRQALVTLVALFGGLSIFAPELAPSAVRAGVWSSTWAAITSLAVFPLLLSGRLGRSIVKHAERLHETHDDVVAPIRLEPVIEAPHFELENARRRVRNAG